MKCHKSECKSKTDETTRRIIRHDNRQRSHAVSVNNILQNCLEMISELQAQIQLDEEIVEDSETAGYNACMVETFRFLFDQGLTADNPMVKALLEELIGNRIPL